MTQLQKKSILQICRLTPLWGIDLFKQISLAYEDHNVITLFLSGNPDPVLADQYHGSVMFFEIDHKKPGWRFKAALKLWKLCRQQAFDIVICHHYKPTVIMDWVSYFCEIKSYFSVHHTIGNLRRLGRRLYTRLSLKRKWQFISVSDGVKDDLVAAGGGLSSTKIKTIYNTIMLEEVLEKQLPREQARNLLRINSDCFVFGTIGRLVTAKGHLTLIQAFAQVHSQMPNAILVILGVGPLEKSLQDAIEKLGLRDSVCIRSEHAKQAGHLINTFDTFVFPSTQEGFGLVLLEAMSAKLPIIASHHGGIPEVMGETGIIVSTDISALSAALLKVYLLSTEERLQMGLKGYQRLCECFLQANFKMALNTLFF